MNSLACSCAKTYVGSNMWKRQSCKEDSRTSMCDDRKDAADNNGIVFMKVPIIREGIVMNR